MIDRKRTRIVVFTLLLILVMSSPLYALTQHEIDMFKTLEAKWKTRAATLIAERSSVSPSDPRYTELTKLIVQADYKENYYKEAQIDRSSMWVVLTNTIVWSASDLAETATIMWSTSENLLENLYTANWTDILKDTADALMRQKVRKMIRETFGSENSAIEDHIISNFISPKLEKSKTQEYAEEAFGKVKDGLKDAYTDEVKRQAVGKTASELKEYGEKIAERVGGAVDAAEFTIDMVQKYVMWDDAQVTIQNMLSAIKTIQTREKCSLVKAFNVYLGKEELTKPKPDQTTASSATETASSSSSAPAPEAAPASSSPGSPPTYAQIMAMYLQPEWTLKETTDYSYFLDRRIAVDLYYDPSGIARISVNYWDTARNVKDIWQIVVSIIDGEKSVDYKFLYTDDNNKRKLSPTATTEFFTDITGKNIERTTTWSPSGQMIGYDLFEDNHRMITQVWSEEGKLIISYGEAVTERVP